MHLPGIRYAASGLRAVCNKRQRRFSIGLRNTGFGLPCAIEVMLVGKADFSAVVQTLAPAQDTIRREINPVVMNAAEFNRKRREKGGFITNVLTSPRLWLIGNENDLPKPAKNRPT